jgi:glycosyltransferase involved in cell wall biosynthesis
VTDHTTASVVVPVYNDPDGVRTTLESLVSQTYPDERYEILVVDNGSTDETGSVVDKFAAAHDNVERLLEDRIQGSYAARNKGIRHAEGSIIAFLDADVTVEEEWLTNAVTAMERRDAKYLACDVELQASEDDDSLSARFNERSGFPIERYVESCSFAPTCCLLVSRRVFEDIGCFDERLVSSGDVEFGNRVHSSGRELHYTPDVTATHPVRSTVSALAKKAIRIGRGRYQLRAYYPDRYGTPLAMLLNPLTYLPPIPWLAPGAFDEFESLPVWEKVGMYVLLTVTKFARMYGKLTQAVTMGVSPMVRQSRHGGHPEQSEAVTKSVNRSNDSGEHDI